MASRCLGAFWELVVLAIAELLEDVDGVKPWMVFNPIQHGSDEGSGVRWSRGNCGERDQTIRTVEADGVLDFFDVGHGLDEIEDSVNVGLSEARWGEGHRRIRIGLGSTNSLRVKCLHEMIGRRRKEVASKLQGSSCIILGSKIMLGSRLA